MAQGLADNLPDSRFFVGAAPERDLIVFFAFAIDTKNADMKNTGPRAGGSITAALFLKQFIKDTPWVHLDVAGPVWSDKENSVNNSGATGFPVRTLVNWVLA